MSEFYDEYQRASTFFGSIFGAFGENGDVKSIEEIMQERERRRKEIEDDETICGEILSC